MSYLASKLSNTLSQSFHDDDDDESSDDDDDLSLFELALALNGLDEELLLAQYGYIKKRTISKTLQGELFVAVNTNNVNKNNVNKNVSVAIKKVSKILHSKRECVDMDGFTFIVDEDIVKESLILKHLTVNNQCISNYVVKYIDFFESETDYYLVIEYIQSNMNLKQFVVKSHEYIKNGKLNLKQYHKIIKYSMWQLAATLHWLHNDMNCCHLDICVENIMLKNAEFVQNSDGMVSINPEIELKLIDFGCSEQFGINFQCNKQHLSLENEQYLSPNIYNNEYYDARACDMWSLGMVIYYCFIGKYPFKIKEETEFNEAKEGTGFWSICNGKLKQHLAIHNLLKFVNPKMLSLLNGLLNIDESKRFKSMNVLQHKWFKCYYQKYSL